jgi:hypothetical protein
MARRDEGAGEAFASRLPGCHIAYRLQIPLQP